MSYGTPDACVGIQEGPAPGTNTFENPDISRRDNLAFGGVLEIKDPTVKGTVSSPYLADGQWTSLNGALSLEEYRSNGWLYAQHYTPILPTKAFVGPGSANFGTRSATMVHGNTYAISLYSKDSGGDSFALNKYRYVKLADDVMVVPIVVVSWKMPGNDPVFIDETQRAHNMFDFNPEAVTALQPYYRNDGSSMQPLSLLSRSPMSTSQAFTPSPTLLASTPPDLDETPPDEVWQSCGIQFQVIAEIVAEHPASWSNACNSMTTNMGDAKAAVSAKLAGQPVLRDYIEELQPVYVSYGDGALCATGWSNPSFVGNTPGNSNAVEINFRRNRATTAHELGHALGLHHEVANGLPVAGNLMRENPKNETTVTAAQCTKARQRATTYSAAFDKFNKATGRTFSATPPPPPVPPYTGVDTGPDLDPGWNNNVCCASPTEAHLVSPGTCSGTEVAAAACDVVCCSDGASESRRACEQSKHTVVACPPPK